MWICRDPSGHLQATGRDARGRKQYRYHPKWRVVRDEAKYGHMLVFGRVLPTIRAQVDRDLAAPGLPRRRVLAAVVLWKRGWSPAVTAVTAGGFGRLLHQRRLLLGALCIFTYVGAEVSIGSSMANYLMQGSVLGVSARVAGSLVSVYWGLAMLGRFAGSFVLRRVTGGLALLVCAVAAGVPGAGVQRVAGGIGGGDAAGGGAVQCADVPDHLLARDRGTGGGYAGGHRGWSCLAIVGGAVMPLLTGVAADHFGLARALLVPVACYVWIAGVWRVGMARAAGAGERLREKQRQGQGLCPRTPTGVRGPQTP